MAKEDINVTKTIKMQGARRKENNIKFTEFNSRTTSRVLWKLWTTTSRRRYYQDTKDQDKR